MKKTRPAMLLMPFELQSHDKRIQTRFALVIIKHYMMVYYLTFKFSGVNSKCTSGLFSFVSLCCKERKYILTSQLHKIPLLVFNGKPQVKNKYLLQTNFRSRRNMYFGYFLHLYSVAVQRRIH